MGISVPGPGSPNYPDPHAHGEADGARIRAIDGNSQCFPHPADRDAYAVHIAHTTGGDSDVAGSFTSRNQYRAVSTPSDRAWGDADAHRGGWNTSPHTKTPDSDPDCLPVAFADSFAEWIT